jgi:hypothetical protein
VEGAEGLRRAALVLACAALAACAAPAPAPAEDAAPDWAAVTAELASRVEEDQALRTALSGDGPLDPELLERVLAVDADNTRWMKALVTAHGWPGISQIGTEGGGNAWLLVQHADQDVDFQEHCLALLRDAVIGGEADPRTLAYLEDRVAMHRGRPQRYGTQFRSREGGGFEPYTLEDPARVDEWRAAVGLEPLAEYAQRFE